MPPRPRTMAGVRCLCLPFRNRYLDPSSSGLSGSKALPSEELVGLLRAFACDLGSCFPRYWCERVWTILTPQARQFDLCSARPRSAATKTREQLIVIGGHNIHLLLSPEEVHQANSSPSPSPFTGYRTHLVLLRSSDRSDFEAMAALRAMRQAMTWLPLLIALLATQVLLVAAQQQASSGSQSQSRASVTSAAASGTSGSVRPSGSSSGE